MYQYQLTHGLEARPAPAGEGEQAGGSTLILLTSEELSRRAAQDSRESMVCHTPLARDARICKAEVRRGYLNGTIVTPRQAKSGETIAFGYLLAPDLVVVCDDTGTARSMVQRLHNEDPRRSWTPAGFFCSFLALLVDKDLRHLELLGDQLSGMEDQVTDGQLENFNGGMMVLRKEISRWIKYYTQMDELVCELQENGALSDPEAQMFHRVEKRMGRLLGEAKALREYGLQLREMFQAEMDLRQNRIMKILTIVTTIFLPLSLVAGWYGMNFSGMPELTWKYGYPAVIAASALIVLLCLYIMKKKKFW